MQFVAPVAAALSLHALQSPSLDGQPNGCRDVQVTGSLTRSQICSLTGVVESTDQRLVTSTELMFECRVLHSLNVMVSIIFMIDFSRRHPAVHPMLHIEMYRFQIKTHTTPCTLASERNEPCRVQDKHRYDEAHINSYFSESEGGSASGMGKGRAWASQAGVQKGSCPV
jgi:hypothetical protein